MAPADRRESDSRRLTRLKVGTDTGSIWAVITYAVCAALVVGMLIPRMIIGRSTGEVAPDVRPTGSAHS